MGFEIGTRRFTLAPEAGGLVMGVGILTMHYIGLQGWHTTGTTQWNGYGVTATFVLGLSLSALSVNRANRPVTRWCRHGASIVMAFMICVMHYALTASSTAIADASILLKTGLSPNRLEVEVTESTLMSDQTRGLHTLRKLKSMGISVAMDDFGTGYSSLAMLHAFPFDKIKLDQSFVKRLPADTAAAAIVRTVLALGKTLGMPVLAEGIETEAQWQFLAREGCDKGQGFLFAKPVALASLPGVIAAAAQFVREDEGFTDEDVRVRTFAVA